jgi:hypothetical protein
MFLGVLDVNVKWVNCMQKRKAKNTKKGLDQELECLILIARFSWLRLQECVLFMWYDTDPKHGYQYAVTLFKKLQGKGLVHLQKMDEHAGTAAVLTITGAKMVRNAGFFAKKMPLLQDLYGNEYWEPNPFWQHDLMTTGLCALLLQDRKITESSKAMYWTEPEINKMPAISNNILREEEPRIPDLLITTKFGIWAIEMERSRKDGQKKKPMIENAFLTNKADGVAKHSFNGVEPVLVAFAFNKDEQEFVKKTGKIRKVKHQESITAAMFYQAQLFKEEIISVPVLRMKIKNFGVVGYEYQVIDIDVATTDPTL